MQFPKTTSAKIDVVDTEDLTVMVEDPGCNRHIDLFGMVYPNGQPVR